MSLSLWLKSRVRGKQILATELHVDQGQNFENTAALFKQNSLYPPQKKWEIKESERRRVLEKDSCLCCSSNCIFSHHPFFEDKVIKQAQECKSHSHKHTNGTHAW